MGKQLHETNTLMNSYQFETKHQTAMCQILTLTMPKKMLSFCSFLKPGPMTDPKNGGSGFISQTIMTQLPEQQSTS